MSHIYRNKKTSEEYVLLGTAVDCTNSRDGDLVVIYCAREDGGGMFVRARDEFFEKFESSTVLNGQVEA